VSTGTWRVPLIFLLNNKLNKKHKYANNTIPLVPGLVIEVEHPAYFFPQEKTKGAKALFDQSKFLIYFFFEIIPAGSLRKPAGPQPVSGPPGAAPNPIAKKPLCPASPEIRRRQVLAPGCRSAGKPVGKSTTTTKT